MGIAARVGRNLAFGAVWIVAGLGGPALLIAAPVLAARTGAGLPNLAATMATIEPFAGTAGSGHLPLPVRQHPILLGQALCRQLILPSAIHQFRRITDSMVKARGRSPALALALDSLTMVKAMLGHPKDALSAILPCQSVREDVARGRFHLRMIDDPDMSAPWPCRSGQRPGLTDQIPSSTAEIRATLEAAQ